MARSQTSNRRRWVPALLFALSWFSAIPLWGQASDPVPASVSAGDEFPDPGHRIPTDRHLPVPPTNDSSLFLPPGISYHVEPGYGGLVDDQGYHHAAGLNVALFLETGRAQLLLEGEYAASEAGGFAMAGGNARVRFRFPLDPRHLVWLGVGGDIRGRGVGDPRMASFFSAAPTVLLGTMFRAGPSCVLHLFARASVAIFDNRTQGAPWEASWNTFLRPAPGAEIMLRCAGVRVMADYDHLFSFGDYGDTDRASLSYSHVWPVANTPLDLGFFLRGEFEHREGRRDLSTDPDRNLGAFFGGMEFRFRSVEPR